MNRRNFLKKTLSVPLVVGMAATSVAAVILKPPVNIPPSKEHKGDFIDFPVSDSKYRWVSVRKRPIRQWQGQYFQDDCRLVKLAPGERVKSGDAVFWNDDGTVRRIEI